MKNPLRSLGLAGAGLLLVATLTGLSPIRLNPAPARDLEERIQRGLGSGEIDEDHAALYRLYAVKAPGRLPAELRSDEVAGSAAPRAASVGSGTPFRATRCGTLAVRAARARLPFMPADLAAEAEALLFPPRPLARTAARTAGKTVAHTLPNWIETANFSIEWGPNLTNEDGSLPLRLDANGIPQVAKLWAAYLEAAYQDEVVNRGFTRQAVLNNLVPVYLGNSDPTTAIDDLSQGTYALTTDDQPTPYLAVNNDFTFLTRFGIVNDEGKADPGNPLTNIHGAMKVTAAHEFFHVLQFLTPLPGVWFPEQDDWWLEVSSVWMEDEVFNDVNDYYQYYSGTQGWAEFASRGISLAPTVSAYTGGETSRAYGGAIFSKYLSEHVDGPTSMKEVWDRIQTPGLRPLDAIDQYARGKGFSNGLSDMFLGFAAANATMDYREGAHYGQVAAHSFPQLSASGPPSPAYLGAVYLLRTNPATGAGLTVNLNGTPAQTWGLAFSLGRGTQYALALGAVDAAGRPSLGISNLNNGDALYAIPAFLLAGATSSSYTTAETAVSPPVSQPGAVTNLSATPIAGGFKLNWVAPATGSPAGFVARWKASTNADFGDARTLFGPVTSVEVTGLAAGAYDVEVFAYSGSGTEGVASRINGVTVGPSQPTPTPAALILAHGTGASIPAPTGGGGGGGGGCFLQTLGW